MKVFFKIFLMVSVVSFLSGCSDENSFGSGYSLNVYSLELDKTKLSLWLGESATLNASIKSSNIKEKNLIWVSTNEKVAIVKNGIVTGVGVGNAVILASSAEDPSVNVACDVTISSVSNISLNKSSVVLTEGETVELKFVILPDDVIDKTVTWSSENESVATILDGVITGVGIGSTVVIATSNMDSSKKDSCEVIVCASENGHKYVDLGLTSGLMWATCNIGAASPTDHGNYYAWGETVTKNEYTQYNKIFTDCPQTLPLENDAARVNWGGNWRMPTYRELHELGEECTWTWTLLNGRSGYKVRSKMNGNYIFLPVPSFNGSSTFWSSTLGDSYHDKNISSVVLLINYDGIFYTQSYCYAGNSIRPVLNIKQ